MSGIVRAIIGLPGSGKTMYAEQNPFGMLFDDPGRTKESVFALYEAIMSGLDVTVTDSYMTDPIVRNMAVSALIGRGATKFEWIYFENDPQACIRNCKNRMDGRTINDNYIRELSKVYRIPAQVTVLPVFN